MSDSEDLEQVARAYCSTKGLGFKTKAGQGAFKETFHVTVGADESLALKVFRPGFPPERTNREIDAMTRCEHSNISKLHTLEEFPFGDHNHIVVLEEYLPGGTLSDRLRSQGCLSRDAVIDLGNHLIKAVSHIADLNLVHRDLKPDNILFRPDGSTPVVVDLGLVRDLSRTSLTDTWNLRGPGTPQFAAPEQLVNDKHLIDWRTDQFALGVVLSYSAFGFHPHSDTGDSSIGSAIDRAATRQGQSARFLSSARDMSLPVLVDMTQPWPVQRIRLPEALATAWSGQG